jgi:hypothetical protein
MLNPIEIRTLEGVRLDVDTSATIEVNMGGISLLSLADRPATYTNSFTLPRTPTNESVFAFASQPTRNNRPVIDVIITKGLFQRSAMLKVTEFEGSYKCTLNYDNGVIESLKNQTIDVVDTLSTYTGATTQTEAVQFPCGLGNPVKYYTFKTNNTIISSYGENGLSGTSMMKLTKWFELLSLLTGITFDGTLFSDSNFNNQYLNVPNYGYKLKLDYSLEEEKYYDRTISASSVISAICKLYGCDIKTSFDTLTIDKLDLTISPIDIETISIKSKIIFSGLGKDNYIAYNASGSDAYFGSDKFTSDGAGINTIENGCNVPLTDVVGYITNDKDSVADKIIIFSQGTFSEENVSIYFTSTFITELGIGINSVDILSMSGFYSDILNPIFANPVILKANGYIDPLTADTIMNDRVINSVRLGGRYWVDQMAYNLTTGNSVLTLIKLP